MATPVERQPRLSEVKTPGDFFRKLREPDADTVGAIVSAVNGLADRYDDVHDFYPGLGSYGFFGLYAIGGNVSKEGDRPDVDLLIATNAYWPNGYSSRNYDFSDDCDEVFKTSDWVAGTMADLLHGDDYSMEILGTIPDEYHLGHGPKTMFRFTPTADSGRKPIDIVYIKTGFLPTGRKIQNLADFNAVDVDEKGAYLPGIPLVAREQLGKMLYFRE